MKPYTSWTLNLTKCNLWWRIRFCWLVLRGRIVKVESPRK